MVRMTREELELVLEAARRVARRTGRQIAIRWDRIEIVDKI